MIVDEVEQGRKDGRGTGARSGKLRPLSTDNRKRGQNSKNVPNTETPKSLSPVSRRRSTSDHRFSSHYSTAGEQG